MTAAKCLSTPGALVDGEGRGWLTFGAGTARIARLGDDMTSISGKIAKIDAPHHFEANELNYINGTYIYTYNTDWQDYADWPFATGRPSVCSMVYMTGKKPLDPKSWKYRHPYMRNPGDCGFDYGNNHTHRCPFKGRQPPVPRVMAHKIRAGRGQGGGKERRTGSPLVVSPHRRSTCQGET